MPRSLHALMLAAALLLSASQALAQQRPILVQGPPLRQACFADYMRLCRGVPFGGGRVLTCLNAQADQLSQTCFQALTVRGLAFAGAIKSCRADYERFCAGVPPGWGRGLVCMQSNAASLSPSCREALQRDGFLGRGDDEPLP
ncbi:MAG: hypothetical protein AB7S70_05460 [Hyphomicrobium sp.]|uniref:hypothetical protein n=1 Tax=Hyphomicrobium sp. TaxID=82 RepID=UPI003D0A931B